MADAKDSKTDYGRDLKNDGYTFQSMVFEVRSNFGTTTVSSVKKISTEETKACSLKQSVSLAIHVANAAWVLGAINDQANSQEFFCRSI